MELIGKPCDSQPLTHADAIRFDNGSTLTDERTNGLTNDYQDQGSNRLVPNAPTPVDNRCSSCLGDGRWGWEEHFPAGKRVWIRCFEVGCRAKAVA